MRKQNANDDLTQHAGGTDHWYKVSLLFPNFTMTDGVKHLAEMCKSFWLLDVILSHQVHAKVRKQAFQVWKIKHLGNDKFAVTCEDGNNNKVTEQIIEYSDFPYEEATIWLTDNVLLLPCEY